MVNSITLLFPKRIELRISVLLAFSDMAIGQINKNKPIRLINRPIYEHDMLFRPQIDLNLTSQHHVPPGIQVISALVAGGAERTNRAI